MTEQQPTMPKKLIYSRALSFTCLLGLNVLYTTTSWLNDQLSLALWIIPCVSLAIFFPGMLRDNHRTYNWMCFVLLIHFIVSVTGTMSELAAWNDFVQLILTVTLFNAAMMTSRWLQAWRHPASEVDAQ